MGCKRNTGMGLSILSFFLLTGEVSELEVL